MFGRQNLWTNGSVKGLLTGQYAGDTLLASDLFSIGGYGSVRGFQPAQSTGNSGLQTSIELDQTVWHNEMWSIAVGPWFDGGWVWNSVPGAALDSSLYSVGLGAELHTGDHDDRRHLDPLRLGPSGGHLQGHERRLRHLLCPAVADLLATA